MALADRVSKKRVWSGMRREDLAAAAGCSFSLIGKIEEGWVDHTRYLPEIAAALGVSAQWLLYGEECEAMGLARVMTSSKAARKFAHDYLVELRGKK